MAALMLPAIRFFRSKVFHARLRPHPHRFSYTVLSMLIDLDRLDEAHNQRSVFSVGGFNILGFSPADHGPCDGSALRPHIEALLAKAGTGQAPHRLLLLAFPRLFGIVFNPISVYYCYDRADRLTALVYEVRNTFGQIHSYVAPVALTATGDVPAHERDKLFYVSPFMDMPLRYRFLIDDPGETFRLKIIERDAQGPVLTALMKGDALPDSSAAMLRAAFASPLFGFKVMIGIHWQALKLWLKGHHLRPRPAPPARASFDEPGLFTTTPPPRS